MNECMDWGDINKAKVLLIGHDPRLKKTDTIAQYCFFADYYFKDDVDSYAGIRKKNLAEKAFNLVVEITKNKYEIGEIYITNLCNKALPHAPEDKIVYIPEKEALLGIARIKELLKNGNFDYVIPTSLQTNYWLVRSGIYECENEFLKMTIIKEEAKTANIPYFEVYESGTFKLICGNIYESKLSSAKFIPLLHPNSYPLNEKMKYHYGNCYRKAIDYFNKL